MNSDSLLSVKNLSVHFQQKNGLLKAVDNIDFDLKKGEILGIVGESGSGKSLSALSIMNLLPEKALPGNSDIQYSGVDKNLLLLEEKEMEKIRGNEIGMIFQEPRSALNPVFSCGYQLSETLINNKKIGKKEAARLAKNWFKKVGLNDIDRIYKAYPHQLSGGQLQRVMIAIAICCEPSLLIADEPTTALDVTIQKKILELLVKIKEEMGMSIIFISHDLAVVAELADRVLVMQKGKIMELGPSKQVFSFPQHPYTKGLIACRPKLGDFYHRLPELKDFLNPEMQISPRQGTVLPVEKNSSEIKLIAINKVSVDYPLKGPFWKKTKFLRALNQVSLDIRQGETMGLVGESGSGKSTLGKVLSQLQVVKEGEIKYNGLAYTSLKANKDFYKKVQIIFQNPYEALNPRLPIGECLLEPLRVHHIGNNGADRRKIAEELLNRVGMQKADFFKYPRQFSGGQRQRICIARALTLNPEFLICDEIVSALDVSVQAQILNLLKDLQEEKKLTYLFISHDLSVVQHMSDRIAVMKKGEIVEFNDTKSIYDNPQHEYTKELLAAIPQ